MIKFMIYAQLASQNSNIFFFYNMLTPSHQNDKVNNNPMIYKSLPPPLFLPHANNAEMAAQIEDWNLQSSKRFHTLAQKRIKKKKIPSTSQNRFLKAHFPFHVKTQVQNTIYDHNPIHHAYIKWATPSIIQTLDWSPN